MVLSDEEVDDEDYVPASLAAFLEQADQALSEQTKMFMDELSPSSTPNPNQSAESTDFELSNLDELQTDMANVSIADRPNSILSTRSDDSAFQSPVQHNPAADLTFSAMDAQTPSSPDRRSTQMQSEEVDPATSPSVHQELLQQNTSDNEPEAQPSLPKEIMKPLEQSPEVSPTNSEGINAEDPTNTQGNDGSDIHEGGSNAKRAGEGPEDLVPSLSKQEENKAAEPILDVGAEAEVPADNGHSGTSSPFGAHNDANGKDEEPKQQGQGDKSVDSSPKLGGEVARKKPAGLETPKSIGSASPAGIDPNDSLGLGTPTSMKSNADTNDDDDPLGLGTPGSIASSGANDDDSFKSTEGNEGAAEQSPPTASASVENPKEERAGAASSTGVEDDFFTPGNVANDKAQEGMEERSQPEARSLFGTFASFARSVVPNNRSPQQAKVSSTPTEATNQQVSASKVGAISNTEMKAEKQPEQTNMTPGKTAVDTVEQKAERVDANTAPSAMTTEPIDTQDEIMEDAAAVGKDHGNSDKMEGGKDVDANTSRFTSMRIETTRSDDQDMMQVNSSITEASPKQGSVASREGPSSSSKITKPVISPSSRLVKPTASRLKASEATKASVAPSSRLFQPTASRKKQITSTPKTLSPAESGKRPTPTRIPQPSATRITSSEKRPAATRNSTSRFMQPTASKRAASTEATNTRSRLTQPTASKRLSSAESKSTTSRFMQPTASKRAHMSETEKELGARKRVAGNQTGTASTRLTKDTAASSARSSSSPNDAVARAKERVRLRKLQESRQTFQSNDAKFNMGSKPKEAPKSARGLPHFAAPTTAAIAHRQASSVSMAQSAVFFGRALRDESSQPSPTRNVIRKGRTTPSCSSRLLKGTAASTAMFQAPKAAVKPAEDKTKAHKPPPVLTMAQCTDFFGKGLRGESSPGSRASRSPGGLTIPEGPKFATDAKYGARSASPGASATLAQSTNLLASTLRGNDPPPPNRGSRPRLTRPESPKFHKTSKRALPKSSAEIEKEQVKGFRARPFRGHSKGSNPGANGNQKSLHTGSSAGLQKVTKRTLTKPEPFQLSSGDAKRSTRMKYETPGKQEAKPTQFRARPMPASTFSSTHTGEKRGLTTPKPFSFAVDMNSKTARDRAAGNRSSSPKKFKARPLPKSTFKPSMPVNLTSPSGETKKKEVSFSTNENSVALRYKGVPTFPAPNAKQSKIPTTPEPFELESVKRHDAFKELVQEKAAIEEEIEKSKMYKALPLPETTYQPRI